MVGRGQPGARSAMVTIVEVRLLFLPLSAPWNPPAHPGGLYPSVGTRFDGYSLSRLTQRNKCSLKTNLSTTRLKLGCLKLEACYSEYIFSFFLPLFCFPYRRSFEKDDKASEFPR
jgi:hypothetical protein